VAREKVRLRPSPASAKAEVTERKAEKEVLRVDAEEEVEEEEVMEKVASDQERVEEEEQEEEEVVSEEEEEEEEDKNKKSKSKISARHRFSESEDDDGDDSEDDGDYLDIKVSSRQSAQRIKKVDTDSEEDNDREDHGIATNTRQGADEREEVPRFRLRFSLFAFTTQRSPMCWCALTHVLVCVVQDVLHVVNTGSMKDLLALHGIGKKRAEAIIDNRPFRQVRTLPVFPVCCVARAC
jgi:hypothetical protein